jgi:transposase-like protein
MEGKHCDPKRERLWRRAMSAWQSSGLSVRQYCLRHDVTEASFYYWRRELQRRDAQRLPSSSSEFVPVTVVPAATLEVRCPSGHVVSLPTANAATLRMLFAALAEEAPC